MSADQPGHQDQPGRRNRRGRRGQPRELRELRVNPVACQAHGVCIELLPELISADPWGYPVIAPGPVPPELTALAERATQSCPTLALRLTPPPDAG
ncbi:MAG TPA: ferredoxin [Streptosporangiaceae bacterium]